MVLLMAILAEESKDWTERVSTRASAQGLVYMFYWIISLGIDDRPVDFCLEDLEKDLMRKNLPYIPYNFNDGYVYVKKENQMKSTQL